MSVGIEIPRIVVAGTQSGVGKTTIVSGLLMELRKRGKKVQSYKVGPDYIDPGYHALASGRPCHNLDSWLVPQERLLSLFGSTSHGMDLAVVEGVMGLFDGGRGGVASTAAIARLIGAPVVLVVNCRSAGESIAAVVLGFQQYDPEVKIAGVILNQIGSDTHEQMVTEALQPIGVRVLGVIRRTENLKVQERHLGLVPVTENSAEAVLENIQAAIAGHIDIEALIDIASQAGSVELPCENSLPENRSARIGVAQDEAFSFYYPESLRVLEEMGAELVPFSPLRDTALPEVDGLLLGGGFPEMFLDQLTGNQAMHQSIREAAQKRMPMLAECGGYMYLCRQVTSFEGRDYLMAGLIPEDCQMEKSLQTVGYVEATALADNVLCKAGASLRGHEFHFSRMEPVDSSVEKQPAFLMTKNRTGAQYRAGFANQNLVASYLHIHFAGNLPAARRFVACCAEFRTTGKEPR
ncbi:MAG: cobyrinate a,c-diamide synthase [Negativicutes bacterium]